MLAMTRYCHDVGKAYADPMMQAPPLNIQNIKTCCEFYWSGFYSSDRRRYSRFLLQDLGI